MNGRRETTRANLSFSDRPRRNRPPKPLPRRQSFLLEPLESRLLLSAGLVGIPDWTAQGPEPILNAGSVIAPNNPVTGAVESIAVNPNNAQQIYVGTANGGIWRTSNADLNNPGAITWTPLTDQQASLAIGAIEFSPLDSTGNTIYAGTGSFSNLDWFAPPPTAIGVLRTTDGGATWTNFAVAGVNEGRIKAIVPTGVDLDLGPGVQEMILVAEVDGAAGVYRSNDNGQTFNLLSGANGLPAGAVSQLIVDPNNANRYYAALPGLGVFGGDYNTGTNLITWQAVNGTGPNFVNLVGASANIQMAAHDDGAGNTTLYVGLANAVSGITATLAGVFRSTDAGANWTPLGAPVGFNAFAVGGSGFNLIADGNPLNNQVVYIGGLGNSQLFRNDGVANTWTQIAGAGNASGNTTPHADSRDMAFIGNNTLVESDDGGIYYLTTPTNANTAPGWRSLIGETTNGNALGPVEFHDIAWDSNSNIIIGGAQDNGTNIQQTTGTVVWTNVLGNDGADVLVDNFTLAGANQSIRYFSSQNLGIGTGNPNGDFRRQVYDAANAPVGAFVELLPAAALNNFTPQFITPIEINAIAPTAAQITAGQSTRIVVGGGGTNPVYESNDAGTAAAPTWTAVNVPSSGTTIGTVTALAYGGRRLGVDNPDVLYVGDNAGNVFVRTTAGGTLTATQDIVGGTAFPGGAVTDIALDPIDWQHAFVTDSSGVWETTNAGQTWVARTGNLSAAQNVTAGNNAIHSVEFAEAGAVDVILVAGQGGVFRMLTNNPGVWSEFGAGLPNAIAYDIDYNAADDPDGNAADGTGVLLVGTLGRGAWTIDNASSFLTVNGALNIFGDDDYFGEPDTIKLVIDGANPSLLDVFINNEPLQQFQLSVLQQSLINVFGLGGDDTLIVDSSNGLINVAGGIHYDGDGGVDGLQLLQTGGPTWTSDTYSVGPAIGSGVSTIVGGGTAGTQAVFFEGLSPVLDLVPAASLTVNATAADNAISYSVGSVVTNGKVTIDEHEPIEFSNKTALTINAGAGQDTITLNNPNTPTGLTGIPGITIIGGDPSSGDTLNVTGVGVTVPVTVNTAAATISGATGAGGAVPTSYGTIETLNLLAGIGDLTITTTAADDTVVVTPGLTTGSNSGTVSSSGAVPQISFVNSGAFTANLGGGNDALVVNGSSNPDTIAVNGSAVAISTRWMVNYSNLEALTVNGNAGSDTFTVTPSAVATFIDGGDPVGQLPGDLLNILPGGAAVTFNAGPGADEGSFVVGSNQPVSFDHIESIGITGIGTGAVEINGTNGSDAITVIADSTHGAANGVHDFTAAVNAGPALLFIDFQSLTINAGSGNDVVTLEAPAPNNAAWDVNVTVNGGTPATDTDQLIVQTPGPFAESVVYTPIASDGGTLNLTSVTSLVTINGIDVLSYDGQGDNDSLTIVGTGGDDIIVHTPGANDQAGSFQVNNLLALSYQNLGGTGTLTVDGQGGIDTLVYNGTAADDLFTVGTAGQVTLNSRLVVNTTNLEALTLQGLQGYDTVSLVGTGSNDNIIITGQAVSINGGMTINANVEDIRLDALGGTNDVITYNGLSGVNENIRVSSSGVAGGGQISVPGVTLIEFSGVEQINVNGNSPTPTETDTVTFAGTNAADIFQIHLEAAGTNTDPILTLQNASGTLTLLTFNYNSNNFNTLNVQGLDGTDTFNVYTAATTTSRNVFIDGGAPAGKKKSTDNLNVFYTPPRPHIIQSAATQDPDAGIVDLDYNTARFVVQYDDIEQVVIRRN